MSRSTNEWDALKKEEVMVKVEQKTGKTCKLQGGGYKKLGTFLLFAMMALSATFGATRTRALVTNSDNGITQSFIMLYDVSADHKWQYVRTVVTPFDGHSRAPSSAALISNVVYVVDWCGWDDRNAANRSSARILKYDLEGNFLGVLVDEVRDSNNELVNQLELLTPSPDGQYLYSAQSFQVNNTAKACVYRFKVSDGSGGPIIDKIGCIRGPVTLSSDGNTLFVTDRNSPAAGNVFIYDYDSATDKFNLRRKLFFNYANSTCYDEDSNLLYVCAYRGGNVTGEGLAVFDLSSESTSPVVEFGGRTNYTQLKLIDGVMYVVAFDGGKIYKMNRDVENMTFSVGSVIMDKGSGNTPYKLPKLLMFNTYTEEHSTTEIARYRFDEPANSAVCTNSISSRWPMRNMGLRTGATGVSGGAVCFTETAACGILEGSNQILGSDFGLFMWMYSTSTSTSETYLFSNRESGNNPARMAFRLINGSISFFNSFVSYQTYTCTTNGLNDGRWRHVGVTKEGGLLSIWVDGVKCNTFTDYGLGFYDSADYVLGGSAERRSCFLAAGTFIDDLRIFDGAPSDSEVAAMYNEFATAAAAAPTPTAPALPTPDNSVAEGYGTVVKHMYAHQPTLLPPAIFQRSNGVMHLLAGRRDDDAPWSQLGRPFAFYAAKGTENWTSEFNPYAYAASFFECPADGKLYTFERAAYDRGYYSFNIWYISPTNGCDGRVGYSVNSMTSGSRTKFFTNDVNYAIQRIPNVAEPDMKSFNILTPGANLVLDGRYYQSYMSDGKVGLLSGEITASVGLSDFQPERAMLPAGCGFPGPVVTNSAGHVATLVPMGTNAQGVATVALASRAAIGDDLEIEESGIELPGADRVFSVRFDEKRGLWWAATAPGDTSLRLYASRNLTDWTLATTVFNVSDTSTTRVADPSFVIDGDDIVLAFNMTCPDGCAPLRSIDDRNYVLTRRVSRFRQYSPWPLGTVLFFK